MSDRHPAPIFDDGYTGPRYTYGLSFRPLATGAVPPGWIIGSDRSHPAFRFGTVDYPYPPLDWMQYELTPVALL